MFPDLGMTGPRTKFKASPSGPETESMRAIMIQFTFGIINKPREKDICCRVTIASNQG